MRFGRWDNGRRRPEESLPGDGVAPPGSRRRNADVNVLNLLSDNRVASLYNFNDCKHDSQFFRSAFRSSDRFDFSFDPEEKNRKATRMHFSWSLSMQTW
jgi:hypothetical protein